MEEIECPKCHKIWKIINGIVEASCDCFYAKTKDDYLYMRFMKQFNKKKATGLLYKKLQTPFGDFVCGSLHPFGISVSKDGFSPLIGFGWGLTSDWQVNL